MGGCCCTAKNQVREDTRTQSGGSAPEERKEKRRQPAPVEETTCLPDAFGFPEMLYSARSRLVRTAVAAPAAHQVVALGRSVGGGASDAGSAGSAAPAVSSEHDRWLLVVVPHLAALRRSGDLCAELSSPTGVPHSLRMSIWSLSLDLPLLMSQSKHTYEGMVAAADPSADLMRQIRLDAPRTFLAFYGGAGEQRRHMTPASSRAASYWSTKEAEEKLCRVLRAFALTQTDVGYTQGINFLAGMFLVVAGADDRLAYWLLFAFFHRFPDAARLYRPGMARVKPVCDVLSRVLEEHEPAVSRAFASIEVDPLVYACQWFLTGGLCNLQFSAALRFWDALLLVGRGFGDGSTGDGCTHQYGSFVVHFLLAYFHSIADELSAGGARQGAEEGEGEKEREGGGEGEREHGGDDGGEFERLLTLAKSARLDSVSIGPVLAEALRWGRAPSPLVRAFEKAGLDDEQVMLAGGKKKNGGRDREGDGARGGGKEKMAEVSVPIVPVRSSAGGEGARAPGGEGEAARLLRGDSGTRIKRRAGNDGQGPGSSTAESPGHPHAVNSHG